VKPRSASVPATLSPASLNRLAVGTEMSSGSGCSLLTGAPDTALRLIVHVELPIILFATSSTTKSPPRCASATLGMRTSQCQGVIGVDSPWRYAQNYCSGAVEPQRQGCSTVFPTPRSPTIKTLFAEFPTLIRAIATRTCSRIRSRPANSGGGEPAPVEYGFRPDP
jgi:hypothetical protein